MTNNQPPELLSDKELREKLVELSPYSDIPNEYNTADLLDLINQQKQAAEKRGELRGRIDENNWWIKFYEDGVLPPNGTLERRQTTEIFKMRAASHKERLATLEAEAKE